VTNNDAPSGESVDERAQTLNTNLQRLIEGIGGVLSASAALLARLQQRLSGAEPAAHSAAEPRDQDAPPPPDRHKG
jgi:hypothetical protein